MDPATFENAIRESIATKQRLLDTCLPDIEEFCRRAIKTIAAGGKLLFCGNGGSSCDAAHAAGELVGWFEKHDRKGYAAIALGHEIPTVTAVGNDKGFEFIFARQVHAIGNAQDMLIGISTSGGSKNVVCAIEAAREVGMSVGVLVSSRSGPMAELADVAIRVPSDNTARIQESHLLCVHMLCAAIEEAMG
jgi:D-sedoheptulose 7-phosphate isomerase